jgi:rhamnosyltransferase
MNSLILMATYNGERFIKQQIESILNQTDQNFKLIIRDDGSTDETCKIINSYVERSNKVELVRNTSEIHGAYPNFWALIHYAREIEKYDYYFFADQDDIWRQDKIEKMISFASNLDEDRPLYVYGDMEVIDSQGKLIYGSINQIMGIGAMKGYSLYFSHAFTWGCDSMVNRKLFMSVPLYPLQGDSISILAHDCYFGKFAIATGNIRFFDQVVMSYRRHTDNVTGNYHMRIGATAIVDKLFQGLNTQAKIHARVYSQTIAFLKQMKETPYWGQVLAEIEKAILAGGLRMVFTMKEYGVSRKQKSREVGIYIIAALKLYKKYLRY